MAGPTSGRYTTGSFDKPAIELNSGPMRTACYSVSEVGALRPQPCKSD
jgi:hypothetical protein